MRPAPGRLEAAVERHRAGDLDGAETLYREVLDAASGNADALNLWGLYAGSVGRSRHYPAHLGPRIAALQEDGE